MHTASASWPLRGIIPPMITPLLDNDTLDVTNLEKLIEYIIGGGVHGLFILGTTGELSSLSYSLRRELIHHTANLVNGRVPLLVGITDTALSESIQLAQTAAEGGAAAVVAAAPYYFNLSQVELIAYYQHLADQLPLPLLLYNMPSHTKIALEPATVHILAQHPNIIGVKDSSGNGVNFQHTQHLLRHQPEFTVLVGPDELTAEVVLLGAHGGINGGANLFPKLYVDMYEAATRRDVAALLPLQEQVLTVCSRLYRIGDTAASYIQGVKGALSLLGLCHNKLAWPLQPFSSKELASIQQYLAEIKVSV
ncbi:dihydrodipicolinate synthase family protein [Adhaeribacter pallidiroseus]|uniref:N-acetylneuraminate lyase n=1 Tax=Adhaeribacter pallidiroseus TaxID=2072847 RepID=A0A369QE50_9BACT|nr:dihydrodipicolinate synthase family protein [Adhaeribacter pallidiroseus]RDC62702.1 N-acetylneuraminate lyase [Adhaeribacter pallidiroseus]